MVSSRSRAAGFSPGLAAVLVLDDGGEFFVKAVSRSRSQVSARLHRQEAGIAAALPASVPAPRLLDFIEVEDWVCLAFEAIDGRNPSLPWRATELRSVLEAVVELNHALTPVAIAAPQMVDSFREDFLGWRELASGTASSGDGLDAWTRRHLDRLASLESAWERAAAGETLLHTDLRADNVLLRPDGRVVFVDWPHAAAGASFVDSLLMVPSVTMQGGPDPEAVLSMTRAFEGVEPDAIDAVLAAVAGYFVTRSALPPDPAVPAVRAFQRAQGEVSLAWLRRRLGWP